MYLTEARSVCAFNGYVPQPLNYSGRADYGTFQRLRCASYAIGVSLVTLRRTCTSLHPHMPTCHQDWTGQLIHLLVPLETK